MFSLIIGGSASGKSEYAERLAASLPGERIYLATMAARDSESLERIRRHRLARAGSGFRTVERHLDLAGAGAISENGTVLLECLGTLLANEFWDPAGGGAEAALRGVRQLRGGCAHLTVVTNEVFSGGADYGNDTLRYMKALAALNRELAAEADFVCEVVCGLPNVLKGEPVCG